MWTPGHFIGGHPALDLTNAVFTRDMPNDDNELLKSSRDVGNWLHFVGLATQAQATAICGIAAPAFMESVWELREASFSIFDALAAGKPPVPEALGLLFKQAAKGLSTGRLKLEETKAAPRIEHVANAEAVIAFLATVAIEAYFVLPRERLHACPRCGWLFLDTSRGGKRRWCSMQTCGNREKVARHKQQADRK
ncbi:CGNR zinc finger domain-containing protein [Shinella granuli]|nr:CGNR zinc finger domain-containing protein [Shinella granuli]